MATVDILGLNKAEVLAGLFNNSKPQGLGFIHFQKEDMTVERAQQILDSGQTYFDYLDGRVMKLNLESDTKFDSWGYDRDNGEGKAEFIVDGIRNGTKPVAAKPDLDPQAADVAAGHGGMLRLALEINRATDFKPVVLRNGNTEAAATVLVIHQKFLSLLNELPLAAYELVMKARDDKHQIWGNLTKPLVDAGLLDKDGKITVSVKNVIASSAEGDELDMIFVPPIAKAQTPRAAAKPRDDQYTA